jgi:hypothetical protein
MWHLKIWVERIKIRMEHVCEFLTQILQCCAEKKNPVDAATEFNKNLWDLIELILKVEGFGCN